MARDRPLSRFPQELAAKIEPVAAALVYPPPDMKLRTVNIGYVLQADDGEQIWIIFEADDCHFGPIRTQNCTAEAEELLRFYETRPRPFSNDVQIVWVANRFGLPPAKARLLECAPNPRWPSGWGVSVTHRLRGKPDRSAGVWLDSSFCSKEPPE